MDGAALTAGSAVAVVIGRNEGARLESSLRSVQRVGLPLVYVDSGSSDGSPQLARRLGISVVELDPRRPFSAGRGRNEGLAAGRELWPDCAYVLFLDGDCELDENFPSAALAAFERDSRCAIVTGHLSERSPDASIYNRLCAMEWRSPAGEIRDMNALGGIMMARISAFLAIKGFDETAIAGEEPDLGIRLLLAGYSIIKIDQAMATHDAHILTFAQWWTRAVRGGHALAHRYARHGWTKFHDGRREIMSDLFWGLLLPSLTLALLWPTRGLSILLLGGYAVLGWRVYRHYLRTGLGAADARLAMRFVVYSKFAHMVGIFRYCRNRATGRFHIIEYK